MYFFGFCYLANQWSNTELDEDMEANASTSDVSSAIVFSFFSVFSWVNYDIIHKIIFWNNLKIFCVIFIFLLWLLKAGSAWLAYQRFVQGNNAMFAQNFEGDAQLSGAAAYSSYSQDDQAYQDPPFSNQHGNYIKIYIYIYI